MVDLETATHLALSFTDAEPKPHFDKISFRIRNKIFATLDESKMEMVVKLTTEQQLDCSAQDAAIHPVPGGWGKQGWTLIQLEHIEDRLFKDILTISYCNVAPKKLAALYRSDQQ